MMSFENVLDYHTKFPSIAVLLAAYNGAEWITDQICSILKQKGVDVTLFISVDLSTDSTEGLVNSIADRDDRVRILPYGQKFGGAAPNFYRLIRDCELVEFDAVALADQDDIWFENKLFNAWTLITQQSVSVVSSNVIAFWPDGKKKTIRKSYAQRRFDYFFEAAGPGCTYVFNSHSLKAFKEFLSTHSDSLGDVDLHDWLAYAFCRHHGYSWIIDNEPSMLYRQHASNQIGSNSGIKAFFKRFELIRSHWYRHQVRAISRLVAPDIDKEVFKLGFMLKNANHLRRKPSERLILVTMRIFGLF